MRADIQPAVREPPSFQVCLDNIQNLTILPSQNTPCTNVFKKIKVQARIIQGLKKKSCPAPPELFTVDFCYKISNNNLRENHHTNTRVRM